MTRAMMWLSFFLLALLTSVALADPVPITGTVNWSESGGDGTCRFQGTADGSVLAGSIYAAGIEFAVTGTVASNGAVSGTMATPAGASIGTFSATLADDQLTGGYFVWQGTPGSWSAPADQLPLPNG